MKTNKRMRIGGSLESAVRGDYQLDIKAIFDEGWRVSQTTKGVLLSSLVVVIAIAVVLLAVMQSAALSQGVDLIAGEYRVFAELTLNVLLAPLLAGVLMMGIKHSVGAKSQMSDLFAFVSNMLTIVLTALISGLLVQFGLMLLILPGIYLFIATSFAVPLVLEKQLSPSQAIWVSIQAVSRHWQKFVLIYLAYAGLFLLGIVTFFIAFIWVAPWYYNVNGILYREVFGVTVDVAAAPQGEQHEQIFLA